MKKNKLEYFSGISSFFQENVYQFPKECKEFFLVKEHKHCIFCRQVKHFTFIDEASEIVNIF